MDSRADDQSGGADTSADRQRLRVIAARPYATPEMTEMVVGRLAPRLHEVWREPRLRDGTYEPRPKVTVDPDWIAEYGTNVVDIASEELHELPRDWRSELLAAAWTVLDYLRMKNFDVDLSDPRERQEAGRFVHNAWVERNPQEPGSPLTPDFADLPPDEQQKDIAQVEAGLQLFAHWSRR